jgi:hypothetical protein
VKNFTKSRQECSEPTISRKLCRGRAGSDSRVCPWWDQTHAPTVRPARGRLDAAHPPARPGGAEPDVHEGLRSARRGQSWHRRSSCSPREASSDGVEPGHTSRPRVRSKSAHAVEFSKTVAPLLEGNPPRGRARILEPARGGPTSIALRNDVVADARFSRCACSCGLISIEPGRRSCVLVADRRNRSARPAARSPAPGARRRWGWPPTGRSRPHAGARGSWSHG